MITHCIHIEFNSERSLQEQLKVALIDAILIGVFPAHEALPSCRNLAKQLTISRNTVALVYEQLVDDGYIRSRARSGYYLHDDYSQHNQLPLVALQTPTASILAPKWGDRFKNSPSDYLGTLKPSNWRQFEYPFIYGQIDSHYFPLAEWRKASKQIFANHRDRNWVHDYIDQDDPNLIEQIRSRVLPKRGINARADEILITLGSQNALYLIAQLLLNKETNVVIEMPGYTDAYNIVKIHNANIISQPIDQEGLILDERVKSADYLYVTPSHQVPTGVAMSSTRRAQLLAQAQQYDQVIIEDDYDAEVNFNHVAPPALKSLDRHQRVIYLSSFSKALSPGLRIGYIVADVELIDELKALRRLMYRHPPVNTQYQLAQFLAQGSYDRYLRQRCEEMKQRWEVMNQTLETYLPDCKYFDAPYTSAFWLKTPTNFNTDKLCWKAAQSSILIESGQQNFFGLANEQQNQFFRMGFGAITQSKIIQGVKSLAQIIDRS